MYSAGGQPTGQKKKKGHLKRRPPRLTAETATYCYARQTSARARRQWHHTLHTAGPCSRGHCWRDADTEVVPVIRQHSLPSQASLRLSSRASDCSGVTCFGHPVESRGRRSNLSRCSDPTQVHRHSKVERGTCFSTLLRTQRWCDGSIPERGMGWYCRRIKSSRSLHFPQNRPGLTGLQIACQPVSHSIQQRGRRYHLRARLRGSTNARTPLSAW